MVDGNLVYTENNILICSIITFIVGIALFDFFRVVILLVSENKMINIIDRSSGSFSLSNKIWASKSGLYLKNWLNKNSFNLNSQNFNFVGTGFLKFCANSSITLGLIGTFLGIMQSASGFNDGLFNINPNDTAFLLNNIKPILNGLDKALGTSVLGLISGMFLGFISYLIRDYNNKLHFKLESIVITNFFNEKRQLESDFLADIVSKSVNKIIPKAIIEATENLKNVTSTLTKDIVIFAETNITTNNLITQLSKTTKSFVKANDEFSVQVNNLNVSLSKQNSLNKRLSKELEFNRKNIYENFMKLQKQLYELQQSFISVFEKSDREYRDYNKSVNKLLYDTQNIISNDINDLKGFHELILNLSRKWLSENKNLIEIVSKNNENSQKLNVQIREFQNQSLKENKKIIALIKEQKQPFLKRITDYVFRRKC